MRRYAMVLIMIIFIFLLPACTSNKDDNKNFLGGYGQISSAAYSDNYMPAFFEDDVYIYFNIYKVNKESGSFVRLCEKTGCTHNTPDCTEYQYANRIFPGKDKIFWTKDKELYYIDMYGKTTYIDTFDTDENGIVLDDGVKIEKVYQINSSCIYVSCSNGSCIYRLDTKEKIYTMANYCHGNDKYIFFYDFDKKCIVRVDINNDKIEYLDNTSAIYPCMFVDDKLYCNTDTGIICYIDLNYDIHVLISDKDNRYTLVGATNESMYYMKSDVNIMTGDYTYFDLFYSNIDGGEETKIEIDNLSPDISDNVFFNNEKIYMIKNDKSFNIDEICIFDIKNNKYNTYINEIKATDSNTVYLQNQESDGEAYGNELKSRKSYVIKTNFYTEKNDGLTGNQVTVMQSEQPFYVDGSHLKTTFYYNVDVDGDYSEQGMLNVFVMCDGIIQSSSIDGSDAAYINQVPYVDEEDMFADIDFVINNASPYNEIMICYYLADSIITDDFKEFNNYNETIETARFSYMLADDYSLEYSNMNTLYSNYKFSDIYTAELDEKVEDIPGLAVISDVIPIGTQNERWNLEFDSDSKLYLMFYKFSGQYNIYLIIDDEPVMLGENSECLLCDINGEDDSLIYDTDVNNIVNDNKKHSAKILVYERNTGQVLLYADQIIQVRE